MNSTHDIKRTAIRDYLTRMRALTKSVSRRNEKINELRSANGHWGPADKSSSARP